jgi:hypothetical protein
MFPKVAQIGRLIGFVGHDGESPSAATQVVAMLNFDVLTLCKLWIGGKRKEIGFD